MISGLWQLAGGHDKNIDFKIASTAMDSLYYFPPFVYFQHFG
jgi:hypothetical protein